MLSNQDSNVVQAQTNENSNVDSQEGNLGSDDAGATNAIPLQSTDSFNTVSSNEGESFVVIQQVSERDDVASIRPL